VSHAVDRGAQASAQTVSCGDATLPHEKKNIRKTIRGAERILPASSAQRQGNPRGDVPPTRWSRWP
jgi:hypothetical protein